MHSLHEIWTGILSEGHKLEQDLLNLRELVDKDSERLMANPELVKPMFTLMRKIRPVFVAPHIAAVSLYADVLEVLANEQAFSVTPIYLAKMEATTGDFVLGLDNTPQYQTEIGLMRSAVTHSDVTTIKAIAAREAETRVQAAATNGGTIDAVGELTRPTANAVVAQYFGAPGPDAATNMRWMRSIFREIFLNLGNDPNMAKDASECALGLNASLDATIAERKRQLAAGEELPDDFLSRLVKLQATAEPSFEDSVIRRLVGGTIVGTVDTNSKAAAQALDQLLIRPLSLEDARQAALADDDALFARYVFEALRFNPQNPFLIRKCTVDTTIAARTTRETTIKAGTLVLVGTQSAMFDPEVFPEPDAFRADRPQDKYIHFGHGIHTCFGRYFAAEIIPGCLKPLIKQPGLRRTHGEGLKYDGAFPDKYDLSFDV